MNLLNNAFNIDDFEIKKVNKRYIIILVIILIIITILLIIRKDYYYSNIFNVTDGELVILVEKEYINIVKEKDNIFIDDIKCGFSIKKIVPINNDYLISISSNVVLDNINQGTYKVFLGKERLFDYITRIIKK